MSCFADSGTLVRGRTRPKFKPNLGGEQLLILPLLTLSSKTIGHEIGCGVSGYHN